MHTKDEDIEWFKCNFCDFNNGYKLRVRDSHSIINEISHFTNLYGVTNYTFVDSDTFVNKKHLRSIA